MKYILLIFSIFLGDNFLKTHIDQEHTPTLKGTYLHNKLTITNYHNYGAFLNFGDKTPALITLISVTLTSILSIYFFFTLFSSKKSIKKLALSLILGGGLSNTYDRIKRSYVVDYLLFNVSNKKLSSIVYNFSDFSIFVGSILLCISDLLSKEFE
ncbi:MAG: signal peptidase II [Lachnospiraceae bacterium]